MARIFLKELKRISLGMAMNKEKARIAKSTHHFSHQEGIKTVIKIEMPANKTMRIERGMRACCMVLSMKFRLP